MGRPREFDLDKALATAEELFWRKGYDGTSLSDLTNAMGIVAPSFYFAFRSKEGLFQRVLERYRSERMGYVEDALRAPTARAVAERLLYGIADALTDPSCPPGCLAINNSMPAAGTSDPVRLKLAEVRHELQLALKSRFAQAIEDGDLGKDADPDALARYILTVGWGMAIEAQSGATRAQLRANVAMALKAWPANQADEAMDA
ncbi:MAG TPA: TetR/AcrR family transcriptional regulator [Caulobacteraceae bacterium]|nr:TetR/AcrR family transcriptional regulator [Caulobacteraceae bacterium]